MGGGWGGEDDQGCSWQQTQAAPHGPGEVVSPGPAKLRWQQGARHGFLESQHLPRKEPTVRTRLEGESAQLPSQPFPLKQLQAPTPPSLARAALRGTSLHPALPCPVWPLLHPWPGLGRWRREAGWWPPHACSAPPSAGLSSWRASLRTCRLWWAVRPPSPWPRPGCSCWTPPRRASTWPPSTGLSRGLTLGSTTRPHGWYAWPLPCSEAAGRQGAVWRSACLMELWAVGVASWERSGSSRGEGWPLTAGLLSQGEALLQKLQELLDRNVSLVVATSAPTLARKSTDLQVLAARGRCLRHGPLAPGAGQGLTCHCPGTGREQWRCLGEARGPGLRAPSSGLPPGPVPRSLTRPFPWAEHRVGSPGPAEPSCLDLWAEAQPGARGSRHNPHGARLPGGTRAGRCLSFPTCKMGVLITSTERGCWEEIGMDLTAKGCELAQREAS